MSMAQRTATGVHVCLHCRSFLLAMSTLPCVALTGVRAFAVVG